MVPQLKREKMAAFFWGRFFGRFFRGKSKSGEFSKKFLNFLCGKFIFSPIFFGRKISSEKNVRKIGPR
jgi:hypothetical protein